jgi:ABC-type amino acid transport substrate-binding protein
MRRFAALLLILLVCPIEACLASEKFSAGKNSEYLGDYRRIPGIAQDDIRAIEALKQTGVRFKYGVVQSGEAFKNRNGSIGGFSVLLCEALSRMFGIPFDIEFYEKDSLLEALDGGLVDFSGEFASTDLDGQRYYMTGPIYERTIKVFTNRNSPSLRVQAEERQLVCAFIEGSAIADRVEEASSLLMEKVFVDSHVDAAEMLRTGSIDAFFDEAPAVFNFETYNFIKTEDYFPLLYSPVSIATANPDYEPVIRAIQNYLENGGAGYLAILYSDGNTSYLRHKFFVTLSSEERAYIRALNETGNSILIAAESDNYPVSFYN